MIKPDRRKMKTEYIGIVYFHLHYLKSKRAVYSYASGRSWYAVPFIEFVQEPNLTRLKKLLKTRDRIRYVIYFLPVMRKLKWLILHQHVGLRLMRLLRLKQDLVGIDFQRDVLDRIEKLL